MAEDRLAQCVTNDGEPLCLFADECIVERHCRNTSCRFVMRAVGERTVPALHTVFTPRPVREVGDAVVEKLVAGGHI